MSLLAADGKTVTTVHLLVDTGADTTLLPRDAIDRLRRTPDPALRYELMGFDGSRTSTQAVDLDMIFSNKTFRGRHLLIDSDRGILGRDVLASLTLLLDGPGNKWESAPLK